MKSRDMAFVVQKAARSFPAVVLTGPRQSGKTTLLENLADIADYRLLEDPDELTRVKADPRAWLDSCRLPVLIDEIQNAPELLPYIRSRIDAKRRAGQWLITGSQHMSLMKNVTESMAGRAAIMTLWPFTTREALGADPTARRQKNLIHRGFYPLVALNKVNPVLWHTSYIQSYLERDLRQLTMVEDLPTFRRFLTLCATRAGQVLNLTDIAAPLGLSAPTAKRWLSDLETTAQIILVPPYFTNLGKRLIKRPKLYFGDTGLLCHLLGLRSAADIDRSPFAGAIFENYVLLELIKARTNAGLSGEMYFFRDQEGLEVDFIYPRGNEYWLIEAKSSSTPVPEMAKQIKKLLPEMKRLRNPSTGFVVTPHGPPGPLGEKIKTMSIGTMIESMRADDMNRAGQK